jgi:predicted RNA-binding Zn ribbon-like protein
MEVDSVGRVGPADRMFVDLVNSEWYDGRGNREDRLGDERWRSDFVADWRLAVLAAPSTRMLGELVELRAIFRSVVEESQRGRLPDARRIEAVASSLHPIPMRLELTATPPTASWVPVRPSWTFVKAEAIRSCLEFLAGPTRDRLRRCDNDGCRWAFIDASRNRSRRWCDPGICGNVSKVRAYRERLRAIDP